MRDRINFSCAGRMQFGLRGISIRGVEFPSDRGGYLLTWVRNRPWAGGICIPAGEGLSIALPNASLVAFCSASLTLTKDGFSSGLLICFVGVIIPVFAHSKIAFQFFR